MKKEYVERKYESNINISVFIKKYMQYGCVSCELHYFEIHLSGFYVELKPHAMIHTK